MGGRAGGRAGKFRVEFGGVEEAVLGARVVALGEGGRE